MEISKCVKSYEHYGIDIFVLFFRKIIFISTYKTTHIYKIYFNVHSIFLLI